MMNKDTFDAVLFISWFEQLVDFFRNLFAKLSNLTGTKEEDVSEA